MGLNHDRVRLIWGPLNTGFTLSNRFVVIALVRKY